MNPFIPQTPDDDYLAADAARLVRIHAFSTGVQDIPGPMGEMFREFVHSYDQYLEAHNAGFTTEAEDIRMGNLLMAHMECWEWLRAGEQR